MPKSIVFPSKETVSRSLAEFDARFFRSFWRSRFAAAQPLIAAQQPLQAGEKNGQLEGLGKVVVSAGAETFEHILGTAARGENQNRNEIFGFAQRGDDFETVNAGQHHVEDDGVEAPIRFEQALERGLAIAGDFDGVAFGLQIEAEAFGEVRFVFDDKHFRHARLLGSSSVTVVPRPSPALSAKTLPPCVFAIERTMKSPRPVPFTRAEVRPRTR